mmetsp:Transcript_1715/g.4200  ORF Transcript_1715/g.4200 Transcript_1715/m.4200 type:complete len:215 (+) Transcript_1715:301-945(+)
MPAPLDPLGTPVSLEARRDVGDSAVERRFGVFGRVRPRPLHPVEAAAEPLEPFELFQLLRLLLLAHVPRLRVRGRDHRDVEVDDIEGCQPDQRVVEQEPDPERVRLLSVPHGLRPRIHRGACEADVERGQKVIPALVPVIRAHRFGGSSAVGPWARGLLLDTANVARDRILVCVRTVFFGAVLGHLSPTRAPKPRGARIAGHVAQGFRAVQKPL